MVPLITVSYLCVRVRACVFNSYCSMYHPAYMLKYKINVVKSDISTLHTCRCKKPDCFLYCISLYTAVNLTTIMQNMINT